MIVVTDILDLIYLQAKKIGLPTYKAGNIPDNLTGERVTVNVKEKQIEKLWSKCFANVNLIVPDLTTGMNQARLKTLERQATPLLEGVSTYDGTTFRYSVYSSQIEEGENYHFVNIKIIVEIINVKL